MTREPEQELRRLAKEATPGPWGWSEGFGRLPHPPNVRAGISGEFCGKDGEKGGMMFCHTDRIANAAYIAAASPQAITELLDELDRLRARVAELEGELAAKAYQWYCPEEHETTTPDEDGCCATCGTDAWNGDPGIVSRVAELESTACEGTNVAAHQAQERTKWLEGRVAELEAERGGKALVRVGTLRAALRFIGPLDMAGHICGDECPSTKCDRISAYESVRSELAEALKEASDE